MKGEVANARARDFLDEKAFRFEKGFHIDVRSVQENDFDLRLLVELFMDTDGEWLREFFGDPAAALEAFDHLGRDMTFDLHVIDARERVALLDFFSHGAVIRQKKESFGIEIEASDRIHMRLHLHEEVGDRRATLRIAHHGNHTFRLVHDDVEEVFEFPEQLAFDFDVVGGEVGFIAELRGFTVYGNEPLFDEFFRFSSGCDPRLC